MNGDEVCYTAEYRKFFSTLNQLRVAEGLEELPATLWSSKLGLLFAARFDEYVNFKNELIEFSAEQLDILYEVLFQNFGIHAEDHLQTLFLNQIQLNDLQKVIYQESPSSHTQSIFHLGEYFKKLFKRPLSPTVKSV